MLTFSKGMEKVIEQQYHYTNTDNVYTHGYLAKHNTTAIKQVIMCMSLSCHQEQEDYLYVAWKMIIRQVIRTTLLSIKAPVGAHVLLSEQQHKYLGLVVTGVITRNIGIYNSLAPAKDRLEAVTYNLVRSIVDCPCSWSTGSALFYQSFTLLPCFFTVVNKYGHEQCLSGEHSE